MARRSLGKAKSVFASLPFFQTNDAQLNMDRAVQAAGYIDTAKTAAKRYREAVLAHPDLSARLKGAWGYTSPEQWNGYVPSYRDCEDKITASPHRALLVELVIEALKRNEDWQHGDNERLAIQPEHVIRAPWKESQYGPSPVAVAARIQQVMTEDEDDN
jgi:hypothetical protein